MPRRNGKARARNARYGRAIDALGGPPLDAWERASLASPKKRAASPDPADRSYADPNAPERPHERN